MASELDNCARPQTRFSGDERVVARAPARPRRRLEVALVEVRGVVTCRCCGAVRPRADFDSISWEVVSRAPGAPASDAPAFGAPRVGRRGARDGALRVLGRAEIRLGAVGAQFLDDVCDFALVLGMAASGASCSVLLQLES